MKKLYVVCWGAAWVDAEGNPTTFCGSHKVYATKAEALKGLVECKDQFYDEIVNNPDYDEYDVERAKQTTHVYGSEAEEYFEIDYDWLDSTNEIQIKIDEVNMEV